MAPVWDLLIRGGTLVDPAQSISAKRDVAFSGSKVAAVGEVLAGQATEVIDATGALVTPGLIDIHTHVYAGLSTGRHADQTSLANGVTTVVDAGSAGWMTKLKRQRAANASTRARESVVFPAPTSPVSTASSRSSSACESRASASACWRDGNRNSGSGVFEKGLRARP